MVPCRLSLDCFCVVRCISVTVFASTPSAKSVLEEFLESFRAGVHHSRTRRLSAVGSINQLFSQIQTPSMPPPRCLLSIPPPTV